LKWLWLFLLFIPLDIYDTGVTHKWPTSVMCLSVTVWRESRSEPLRASKFVYDVVLERSIRYGKDVCETVLTKHQFQGMTQEKIVRDWKKGLTLLQNVGNVEAACKDCLFFYSGEQPVWARKMRVVKKVGKLTFLKEK